MTIYLGRKQLRRASHCYIRSRYQASVYHMSKTFSQDIWRHALSRLCLLILIQRSSVHSAAMFGIRRKIRGMLCNLKALSKAWGFSRLIVVVSQTHGVFPRCKLDFIILNSRDESLGVAHDKRISACALFTLNGKRSTNDESTGECQQKDWQYGDSSIAIRKLIGWRFSMWSWVSSPFSCKCITGTQPATAYPPRCLTPSRQRRALTLVPRTVPCIQVDFTLHREVQAA